MKIVIILFLLSTLSFAQEMSELFIVSSFQPGLPKDVPFKWKNASYVKINSGDLYKTIYIVSLDSLKTLSRCWSIVNEKESFDVSQIEFSNDNKKESTIRLITEDKDEISPLKLVFNIVKREISYRWENTRTNEYANPSIIKENIFKVGKTFPIIKIKIKQGEWTNNNKNKIIVINWWATSCVPCREEIPGLNKLVEKYKGRDIEFVAIIHDKQNLSRFLGKYKFNYQQGYSDNDMSLLFGLAYPRHFIIDRNNKIIYSAIGGSKDIYEKLDNIIKTVL